tara:strand:+ start:2211 stop:2453 length:243 start_codon:yes stop_codon:yes gene_type:complete
MWRAPRIAGVPVNKETLNNLTQAAKDVAKNRYAPKHIIKHRLSICETCPHKVENRCKACGCFLKAKTALLNSTCPIKKWD